VGMKIRMLVPLLVFIVSLGSTVQAKQIPNESDEIDHNCPVRDVVFQLSTGGGGKSISDTSLSSISKFNR